jgi:hypothetical protein
LALALGELCNMAAMERDPIVFWLHGFEWSFPFLLGIAPGSSLHHINRRTLALVDSWSFPGLLLSCSASLLI